MAIFDGQRNVTWTEALRLGTSAIAKSHGIATSVEFHCASAIAKSHGIVTPWHAIFERGRNICSRGHLRLLQQEFAKALLEQQASTSENEMRMLEHHISVANAALEQISGTLIFVCVRARVCLRLLDRRQV